MEFVCVCPSGLKYTKSTVNDLKKWRIIVMNYLKINRLYNNYNAEKENNIHNK